MNWKKYYENINYDLHTRNKVKAVTLEYQNTLQLPRQIVELYKKNYQITTPLEDEALTKLFAYGRVFIVRLAEEKLIIDEYTNKAIFRQIDDDLFYLEFILHKRQKREAKVIDVQEKHIFERKNEEIIHRKIIGDVIKEAIVDMMPLEFVLEIAGKKGVPCYYQGLALIGEINALYQKIMHYYEFEEYVFLQVIQDIVKETKLLRFQLQALYYILGIQPLKNMSEFTELIDGVQKGSQQVILQVGKKMLDAL